MRDVRELCVVGDPIHVQKLFARESGDPVIDLVPLVVGVRVENPIRSTATMNGCGKSDTLVVPEKSSNKPSVLGAERMEERHMKFKTDGAERACTPPKAPTDVAVASMHAIEVELTWTGVEGARECAVEETYAEDGHIDYRRVASTRARSPAGSAGAPRRS